MFTSSPHYATLGKQVAATLAERIGRGDFGDSLPGERWLADSLQVSRRTVRAALGLLRREKIIETLPGQETRVLRRPLGASGPRHMRAIGLLLPAPVDQLEPYSTASFDLLRGLLVESGYRLETHAGPKFFSRRPGAALAKLTARFHCDAWILTFSNRACQAWFHSRRLPVVILGTAHEGLDLPYVDVDMHGIARHAANFLLGRGHRRLCLVLPEKNRAGDRRTEAGFLEAARSWVGADVATFVFRHDGTMTTLRRMTDRILKLADPPTALFIANPYHYIAVAGLLAERGLKVPRDISLLCREDDYCLRYLPVEPSRYRHRPERRARAMFAAVMHALAAKSNRRTTRQVLLLPEFVAGASVARRADGAGFRG
jgi:LacI family transcriptional regulator